MDSTVCQQGCLSAVFRLWAARAQPHFTPVGGFAKWIFGLKFLPGDFEEASDVLKHVHTISALSAD